ncbi:hypothetical protein NC652_019629 [Populus alba x Populus x berolinensis]|uniref:Uncharacterized protein n=3 Tax=Populus TaxID=3689 RepID=A0A4U5N8I8_POPAL|nr:hypothetical protein NC652_019629 [Populus alba x Populus x berolinensis]TKR78502.1 hypothetical protein D5086_0000280670 [Populus alba]
MKFLARFGSCSFSTTAIAAAPEVEDEDVDVVEEAAAATTVINGDVTLLAPGSGRRSKSRGRGSWRPALSAISEDRRIVFRRRKPAETTEKKALATKVMKKPEAQNLTTQMSFSGFSPTPFMF